MTARKFADGLRVEHNVYGRGTVTGAQCRPPLGWRYDVRMDVRPFRLVKDVRVFIEGDHICGEDDLRPLDAVSALGELA